MQFKHISGGLKTHCTGRYFLIVATATVLLLSLLAAHAAPPFLSSSEQKSARANLSQRPQIRFLTGTDFPPFNSLSEDGRLTGYNIDLIRAICQELALTSRCQIEARPWDELQKALQQNQADALVAGLMPDRQQRQFLSFSQPYFSLPARFIVTKTEANKPTATPFSPDGKKIGVLQGSAHEALLKTYFTAAQSLPYKSSITMYQDLKTGKIQAIFGDAMSLSRQDMLCCQFVGGVYPAPEFLGQGMTIATHKQDNDLQNAFNSALTSLERKGVLNDLYLQYFPIDFY